MATSNETAARLSALVRERLVELGRVGEAEITLSDGNRAGRGDLIRARLNTRIDADGQTLANRDVVRAESINDSGFGRLAAVRRQTGPDQWSRPFFVPVAYLESDAELAYAGNVHVAQGRTVDRGHLVVDSGAIRSLVYTGATRGREKNTIHVVTGAPDPAQPTRAEREAYAAAQIRRAAALREAGRPDLAREVRLRMPDRPSDRQLAPWEAVLAQALQQDEPERTALEVIQAGPGLHDPHRSPPGADGRRSGAWTSCRRSTRWSASGSRRPSTSGTGATRSGPRSCKHSASTRSAAAGSRTCWTRSPPSRWTGSAASPRDCTAGREKSHPLRGA